MGAFWSVENDGKSRQRTVGKMGKPGGQARGTATNLG